MIKVLFVCHGNICRSPMAEFMLKKKTEDLGLAGSFVIESAATTDDEIFNGVGSPVYPPAKAELSRHGISAEGKRARKLTAGDIDRYDYLIGMDYANVSDMKRISGYRDTDKISLMMSWADEDKPVADPWYTRDFRTSYRDIDLALDGFIAKLKEEGKI